MGWRELLVTALVTLVVTIIAGLVVWMLTREPKTQPSGEVLTYKVEEVATFPLGESQIGFSVVKVANRGDTAAKQVRIVVEFASTVEIRERQIQSGVGFNSNFVENQTNEHTLDITLASLVKGEVATISMLLGGAVGFDPSIIVRSAESTGTAELPDEEPARAWSDYAAILFAVIVTGLQVVILVRRRSLVRGIAMRFLPRSQSANNLAFVYLQKKLAEEAKSVLSISMERNGGDPITLSNYALALGLTGDVDGAVTRFDVSEWWAATSHEKAIVAYDRATLMIHLGDIGTAKEYLKEAFNLSRDEVARYCLLSDYIQEAAEKDDELHDLIEAQGGLKIG